MHTVPIHTASRARFHSRVNKTDHAENYAGNRREWPKLRMQILVKSAREEKIKQHNSDSDKR
jgi:hypothetical protein